MCPLTAFDDMLVVITKVPHPSTNALDTNATIQKGDHPFKRTNIPYIY